MKPVLKIATVAICAYFVFEAYVKRYYKEYNNTVVFSNLRPKFGKGSNFSITRL